jgi:hypothetical protein
VVEVCPIDFFVQLVVNRVAARLASNQVRAKDLQGVFIEECW